VEWQCQPHLRWSPQEGSHAHQAWPDCFPEEARPRTQVSEEPCEGWIQGEEGHIQALQEVIAFYTYSSPYSPDGYYSGLVTLSTLHMPL